MLDASEKVGGINLNANQLNLQETGGQINVGAGFDAAMPDKQINGFSPVILSVTPLEMSQSFFGEVNN
ncbi:MAG: hypothetical protein HQL22_12610 [Candidatus Omnitrophica bacterium]|nr:hypothetical protein [Candidatus Omnitrophota bacterium]